MQDIKIKCRCSGKNCKNIVNFSEYHGGRLVIEFFNGNTINSIVLDKSDIKNIANELDK